MVLEQLDIAHEGSRQVFVETIKNKYGEVECLVNNAGKASVLNLAREHSRKASPDDPATVYQVIILTLFRFCFQTSCNRAD